MEPGSYSSGSSSSSPGRPPDAIPSPRSLEELSETTSPVQTHKKTRFILISDTHNHPLPAPPEVYDVALFCGDHTNKSTEQEFRRFMAQTRRIKADRKFLIPGNHEYSLDPALLSRDFPRAPSQQLNRSDTHLVNRAALQMCEDYGIEFLEEGHHIKNLKNGTRCELYTSSYTVYRKKAAGPGFKYRRDAGHDFNIPPTVHVAMTHGPPLDIKEVHDDKSRYSGCAQLRAAVAGARPLLHCFGHNHEGAGILRVVWNGTADGTPLLAARGDEAATKATKDDILTKEDLTEYLRGKGRRTKCYQTSHCAGDDLPVVKGQHTLFVNAAYERHREKPDLRLTTNVVFAVDLELPLHEHQEEPVEAFRVEERLDGECVDINSKNQRKPSNNLSLTGTSEDPASKPHDGDIALGNSDSSTQNGFKRAGSWQGSRGTSRYIPVQDRRAAVQGAATETELAHLDSSKVAERREHSVGGSPSEPGNGQHAIAVLEPAHITPDCKDAESSERRRLGRSCSSPQSMMPAMKPKSGHVRPASQGAGTWAPSADASYIPAPSNGYTAAGDVATGLSAGNQLSLPMRTASNGKQDGSEEPLGRGSSQKSNKGYGFRHGGAPDDIAAKKSWRF